MGVKQKSLCAIGKDIVPKQGLYGDLLGTI
jgi:hypothetical protein